ncbi:acetoacetyl-CoA reductase [Methylohalomonas lacus]|uniref:Acetoacetyl-CoA reductase n=1 Tax=Methylohalomonas lacus TaxID=398773 RepID=A0AAE3L3Z6_9GAMM|nr:acetoacetyl-CoA reductase [Methylohalomonas lacus]MCS3903053.1 acetoacetyl-CoA reductase [Methylohalomonas lacus]
MAKSKATQKPAVNESAEAMQSMHEHLFNQWQQSLDMTFNSFMRMTEAASEAMETASRQQSQAMSMVIDPYVNQFNMVSQLFGEPNIQPRLGQRVALVTGGIGGIGSAICRRLADDHHYVVASYIPAEAELAREWQRQQRADGYDFGIVECNVADYDSCTAMAEQLDKECGRVDVLVNAAGITRDSTLRKMDPENWHAVMDTNLDSIFNVTRQLVDMMVEREYGRVINISSVNGQKGQLGQTNYSAAKAGMVGFTKSLALELAETGVTVNTVSPGYVATKMVEAIPDEVKQQIISKIPAGRLGKPEEIAAAVAYLAREDSGYITGSDLAVNGGLYTGYR